MTSTEVTLQIELLLASLFITIQFQEDRDRVCS